MKTALRQGGAIKAMPLWGVPQVMQDDQWQILCWRPFLSGGHFLTAPQFFLESPRIPQAFTLTQSGGHWWFHLEQNPTYGSPDSPGELSRTGDSVAKTCFRLQLSPHGFSHPEAGIRTWSTLEKCWDQKYIYFTLSIYLFFILVLKILLF